MTNQHLELLTSLGGSVVVTLQALSGFPRASPLAFMKSFASHVTRRSWFVYHTTYATL